MIVFVFVVGRASGKANKTEAAGAASNFEKSVFSSDSKDENRIRGDVENTAKGTLYPLSVPNSRLTNRKYMAKA